MSPTPLTDDQCWVLIATPESISDEIVALIIDAKLSTVHAARWRLKRFGWTCSVSYAVCPVCQQTFTRKGFRTGRKTYHPDCRKTVLKQLKIGYEEKRWERLSEEERKAQLARAHQHSLGEQYKTMKTATNNGSMWHDSEDEVLRQGRHRTDGEIARELNRTLYAVKARKRLLKARNRMDGA